MLQEIGNGLFSIFCGFAAIQQERSVFKISCLQ